jgi:thioesterase domain-containing protein
MPDRDDQFKAALSDLANALQVAAPIAERQRRELGDLAQDAVSLEAAVDRAVQAVRRLQPGDRETDGDR